MNIRPNRIKHTLTKGGIAKIISGFTQPAKSRLPIALSLFPLPSRNRTEILRSPEATYCIAYISEEFGRDHGN